MEATETIASEAPASEETEDSVEGGETAKSNPEAFDAKKIGEPLTPAEKIKLKFKSKIDGVEEDIELDEDTIRRDYQKWKAADKRFQESAQMRKQYEDVFGKLKSKESLIDVLKQLGHDPLDLAEGYLADHLQYQMMSPEKKRIYELETQVRQRDQLDKSRQAQEKQAKETEARERLTGQLQTEVIGALKASNLPQTSQMVSRMAQQMKVHLQKGIDISATEAAALVQKELIEEKNAIFPKMEINKIKEILGKDMVAALLKDSLSQVKDPVKREGKRPSDAFSERVIEKPDKGYITQNEFEKHMQKIRGKK